tara:strand:+ start:455 stop:1465 length:1011 start_codon:yes stop_codon:yes gene_type:complete
MIRHLRPSDLNRVLFLRPAEGGTQAFTLDSATHPSAREYRASRYIARTLAWRDRRDGWIAFGRSGVTGIVRVRRRNGPTVWEIGELFLSPDAQPEIDGAELLGDLSDVAASSGIHRVFLRIEDGNPMATAARRAGFILQTRETLYRRPEDLRGAEQIAHYPGESGWRTVQDEDLQRIFRLYGSATPLSVRQSTGMTLQEWRESLEPLPRTRQQSMFSDRRAALSRRNAEGVNFGEMVLDGENGPTAWMRYSDASNERLFTFMVEPEAQVDLNEVVRGVLAGGFGMPAAMLVPLYARRIAMALQAAEFVQGHDYELFARQTAERAKIPQNAMAAAGG